MPVASLYSLAKRACIRNIANITDIGDVPYEYVRPVLLKLTNPKQLRDLEKANPQLVGADSELWHEFVKRDVENGEQKIAQFDVPASYKMWRKLTKEERDAMDRDAEELAKQMQSIKNATAQRTSKVIEASKLPKLPRLGGMRVEKGRGGGPIRHSSGDPSTLSFTSGSKTKTLTGQGVISKARREAREMSLFSAKKSVLSVPTHQLGNKASFVSAAPRGFVDTHKRTFAPVEIVGNTRTILVPKAPSRGLGHPPPSSSPPPRRVTSPSHRTGTPPQPPGGYKIPRQGISSPEKSLKPSARSRAAPADPFMPSKRRRIT